MKKIVSVTVATLFALGSLGFAPSASATTPDDPIDLPTAKAELATCQQDLGQLVTGYAQIVKNMRYADRLAWRLSDRVIRQQKTIRRLRAELLAERVR